MTITIQPHSEMNPVHVQRDFLHHFSSTCVEHMRGLESGHASMRHTGEPLQGDKVEISACNVWPLVFIRAFGTNAQQEYVSKFTKALMKAENMGLLPTGVSLRSPSVPQKWPLTRHHIQALAQNIMGAILYLWAPANMPLPVRAHKRVCYGFRACMRRCVREWH